MGFHLLLVLLYFNNERRLEGHQFTKLGRKCRHDRLSYSSQVNIFRWRHFPLVSILLISHPTKKTADRIRLQESKLMPENFPAGQFKKKKADKCLVSLLNSLCTVVSEKNGRGWRVLENLLHVDIGDMPREHPPLLQRRWTWTGDFKCREVKTGFYRNKSLQTGSSGTLIGWKSGQTTFVPLWDWMEGAWLQTQ